MLRGLILLGLLVGLAAAPLLLRQQPPLPAGEALDLVIISPHNETIREEFGRAFSRWHEQHWGRPVQIDWRDIGGTSDIARYLDSQYTAAFRAQWEAAGHSWSGQVASAFNNRRVTPDDPEQDSLAREARSAFLGSNCSIGIDLFFGGGQYDHAVQAGMGHTVPCGYRDTPEGQATLEREIPRQIGGEEWYDDQDRWYGAALSTFGLCWNSDILKQAGDIPVPQQWRDLARPELFTLVALADPTKSGSINKAFEMVVQQSMGEAVAGLAEDSTAYQQALAEGWYEGLNLIRLAGANARYFTDSASQVVRDVAAGEAAAGMCIDFYGQTEAARVADASGHSRMGYRSPRGGTTVSCDPIAMLRGAPNGETALRFIIFVLSLEGQKLWAYRPGTPGGPEKYALHRMPIRRDFYTPENLQFCSDPEIDPYTLAQSFTYHGAWTGPLFNVLRVLIRAMCMDRDSELRAAWRSIIAAGGPSACPAAMTSLNALPADAEYERISETAAALKTNLDQVRQARRWGDFFARQYRQAEAQAQQVQP